MKSSTRNVMPMPNIITPKSIGICGGTHLSDDGITSAIIVTATTRNTIFFVTNEEIFSIQNTPSVLKSNIQQNIVKHDKPDVNTTQFAASSESPPIC